MTTDAPVPQTEILSSDECWDLLRLTSFGRLAVWANAQPEIFPLNYKVDHDKVVFRTSHGTKLASALGSRVALEIDGTNDHGGVAWSVIVKGPANRLERTPEVLNSVGRLLVPWEAGKKDHFVGITPEAVTGRRFRIAAPLTWGGRLDDALRAGLE
ncbi:pyridoxamine 5'-phosphate oxidase family protein [Arthrobacter sp. CAN_A1]|uniref:pyridoxamine 5'-phosphate oxidase family protein n=1 Tax=Arthrobacter sp. CAN_A1 TaxID=2787717 RepID=UPI0018CAB34D